MRWLSSSAMLFFSLSLTPSCRSHLLFCADSLLDSKGGMRALVLCAIGVWASVPRAKCVMFVCLCTDTARTVRPCLCTCGNRQHCGIGTAWNVTLCLCVSLTIRRCDHYNTLTLTFHVFFLYFTIVIRLFTFTFGSQFYPKGLSYACVLGCTTQCTNQNCVIVFLCFSVFFPL